MSTLALGLLSGTSLDGVDAALVRIEPRARVTLVAFLSDPYAADERRRILEAIARGGPRELADLNVWLGERFAGVVERLDEPDAHGRWARLTVDLQEDFALNQPLSPLALAAIELLDVASPAYPLDVVSVIESTLDSPRPVIAAQVFKARGEAVAQMKADGVGYEERLELLDDGAHPQPLADLLAAAYDIYKRGHPWVADHELAPKAVARDMYERAMTFTEYIGFYGLARSEGLVLRYLADAYQALRQTVPEEARTEELTDLTEWLGELVRQGDSSLIDEWERLRDGGAVLLGGGQGDGTLPAAGAGHNPAVRVLFRNARFRRAALAPLGRAGSPRCCVLGIAHGHRYGRSLRPCLATPSAPARRSSS